MKNKISISQKEKSWIDKDLKNIFIKLIVTDVNRISKLEYNQFHKLIKDNYSLNIKRNIKFRKK